MPKRIEPPSSPPVPGPARPASSWQPVTSSISEEDGVRTIVRGGTVVTAADTVAADVLVDGESVLAVVAPGSTLSEQFATGADVVVEARGMLVIPGGVDAHTHFESRGQSAPVLDTFETGTRASAFGGTTTIIDFAAAQPGGRMPDAFEDYLGLAAGRCAVDYGFHMNAAGIDELSPKEMDLLVDEGVTSFKMFMAYPGRLY